MPLSRHYCSHRVDTVELAILANFTDFQLAALNPECKHQMPGVKVFSNVVCRSYSPRRVRARRGDTLEHENGVASSHARNNGATPAITHQVTLDAVGSIAILGTAPVSS